MANNKDFKVKNGIKPKVYHESLGTTTTGTGGYYMQAFSYDDISYSFATQDNQVNGIFFKPDGTKMFIAGNEGNTIEEYTISPAWDLEGTITNTHSEDISGKDSAPFGLFFSSDGLRMYFCGGSSDSVHQYDLGTAWDLSTLSFVRTRSVTAEDTNPTDVFFKPDGTKMFILGSTGDDVNQYDLGTAWDISTETFVDATSIQTETNSPQGFTFKPDGTKMYTTGAVSDSIHEYTLTTAWDTSTLSFVRTVDISDQETSPLGLTFKDDGTKLYLVGNATDSVLQYSTHIATKTLDLSTGNVFNLDLAENTQVKLTNPSSSGTVSSATAFINLSDAADINNIFNTTIYDGTGAEQTIVNGIDLSGQGGLVWTKRRDGTGQNIFIDTERGAGVIVRSPSTDAQYDTADTQKTITAFNSDGYSLGTDSGNWGANFSTSYDYVSWTFRKASKFFDIVEYTGNNTSRQISHSLGDEVGFIAIKALNESTTDWICYHRSVGEDPDVSIVNAEDGYLKLNDGSFSATSTSIWGPTAPTSTNFTVSDNNVINKTGTNYVAYIFAHNEDSDSGIKCGHYDGNVSTTGPIVNVGWEPQWLMIKSINSGGDWHILDTVRGIGETTGSTPTLEANDTTGEDNENPIRILSTGFQPITTNSNYNGSNVYLYVAIKKVIAPTIEYDGDIQFNEGSAPTSPAVNDTDVVTFTTRDGGTTYTGFQAIDGAQ